MSVRNDYKVKFHCIHLPQESTQKDLAPTHSIGTGAEEKGNGTRRCGSTTHVAIRKTESPLIRVRSGSVSAAPSVDSMISH